VQSHFSCDTHTHKEKKMKRSSSATAAAAVKKKVKRNVSDETTVVWAPQQKCIMFQRPCGDDLGNGTCGKDQKYLAVDPKKLVIVEKPTEFLGPKSADSAETAWDIAFCKQELSSNKKEEGDSLSLLPSVTQLLPSVTQLPQDSVRQQMEAFVSASEKQLYLRINKETKSTTSSKATTTTTTKCSFPKTVVYWANCQVKGLNPLNESEVIQCDIPVHSSVMLWIEKTRNQGSNQGWTIHCLPDGFCSLVPPELNGPSC
jgi:hypothetical protein